MTTEEKKSAKPRGFAGMDKEVVRAIARKGGLAQAAAGTGHKFSHDEAVIAGRLGGKSVQAKRAAAKAAIPTNTQPVDPDDNLGV